MLKLYELYDCLFDTRLLRLYRFKGKRLYSASGCSCTIHIVHVVSKLRGKGTVIDSCWCATLQNIFFYAKYVPFDAGHIRA